MIAYFFPPVGGIATAGSQRTLKFAKYLPHYGWEPIVLTVNESSYETYLAVDPTLLERVPVNTKIIRSSVIRWLTRLLELKNRRCRTAVVEQQPSVSERLNQSSTGKSRVQSLKDALTDLFEIPDGEIGWLLPGIAAGRRAMKSDAIDVIYATGKPWTAHLIGACLKFLTGKPLIVDFRDPWMTNPFRENMSGLRDRIEGYMEKKVIGIADVVATNTHALKDEFMARFPQESGDKFVTLLNGFDPEDGQVAPNQHVDPDKFTITHTGFLYGKRDPRLFLEAIAFLIRSQRIDRRKFKVCLVGSVELPYDLMGYLQSCDLDEVVRLIPQVSYQQSLQYLANSDALLLLQPGTTTQVPSKLFEYIALAKPVIAVSPRDGATSRIVQENSLGTVADAESLVEVSLAIEQLYRHWHSGCQTYRGNCAREKFDVKNVTALLAKTLDDVRNE